MTSERKVIRAKVAFVEKARDIIGLHPALPARVPVLCVDGKPRTQAAQGTAPSSPRARASPSGAPTTAAATTRPACSQRSTWGGRRVVVACEGRHRGVEFRAFLDRVGRAVPPGLEAHLVLDNPKTHKARPVHDRPVERPRRHPRSTPTGASWLNPVERWFALPGRRRLARGAFTSTGDLEAAIQARIAETDADPKPSPGPRPPATSSPASPASANGLPTQATRKPARTPARK